jgi:hypothetical protein
MCGLQIYGQESMDLSPIERTLVDDALKNINLQLNHKKGTLERIACCYKVAGNDPLSASIKTFYVDYRKTADYQNYSFKNAVALAKCDPDQIIEIIYKSNEKNQLTIVSKKNKRRSCKHVEIS